MPVTLLTFKAAYHDGEVMMDETTPVDVDSLVGFQKDFQILGRTGTIEVSFDPPLLVAEADR